MNVPITVLHYSARVYGSQTHRARTTGTNEGCKARDKRIATENEDVNARPMIMHTELCMPQLFVSAHSKWWA